MVRVEECGAVEEGEGEGNALEDKEWEEIRRSRKSWMWYEENQEVNNERKCESEDYG